MPEIRQSQDYDRVAALLSLAFADDPIMRWMLPDGRNTLRARSRLFKHSVRTYARGGVIEITEEATAVAVWGSPHAERPGRLRSALDRLRGGIMAVLAAGSAVDRATRLFETMQAHHPRSPHWYLAAIGTHPDARGKGAASSLLAARLKICDREGTPAYLESSNLNNLPLYERHGFEILRKITVGNSPPLWLMTRPPHRPRLE